MCGYMISIFVMLCIPLCLRSLRAFSSAYVWVIAGICRSCSVLVFVLWLLGVCVVVVMVVCVCCQPRFVASFVIVCCCCCVMVFVVVAMIVCVVSCWVCCAMLLVGLLLGYSRPSVRLACSAFGLSFSGSCGRVWGSCCSAGVWCVSIFVMFVMFAWVRCCVMLFMASVVVVVWVVIPISVCGFGDS